MKFVHSQPQEEGGAPRRRRALPALVVSAALLVGGGAAAGDAAAASGSSAGAAANICRVASNVRSTISNPVGSLMPTAADLTSPSAYESRLKTLILKIQSEEPQIIAASPSAIQPDMRQVFTVENFVANELKAAHWNILALASKTKSLEAQVNKIKPALTAIENYFKTKC